MSVTVDLLKNIDVFEGLHDEHLAMIERLCKRVHFKAGDLIFSDKSHGDEMYVILEGKVNIQLESITPYYEIAITTLQKGQIFGEFALIDNEPRSATATCPEEVEALVIQGNELKKLCEENTRIGYVIMRNLSKIICNKVRTTNRRLLNIIRWRLL